MFVAEEHSQLERLKEEKRRAKGEFKRIACFTNLSQRWFIAIWLERALQWIVDILCTHVLITSIEA
jgi:hypothetical protein